MNRRVDQRIAILQIIFLALAVVSYFSYHTAEIRQLLTNETSHESELQLSKETTISPAEPTFDLKKTKVLDLFGTFIYEPEVIDAEVLPETTLALRLVGIIGHSNPTVARSLIAEAGKPARPYFQGDKLPGDARLLRIDRQFVIIQRGGQLEKLQFVGGTSTARAPAKRRSIAEAVTETPASPVAVETTDPGNPAAVYDGLRERLARIRREQQQP